MYLVNKISGYVIFVGVFIEVLSVEDEYNTLYKDGSFEFGYRTPDSYHYADGNRNNVVKGEFGARDPKTGAIDSTIYTAGPRGFRPRGKNVVRKYDLSQSGPRPVGSPDDPLYDPYEDPSYSFSFRTRTYNRDETANRLGDVNGRYSYRDDVGETHNVEFVAGKNTGFHVKTPFPDSNPRAYGPLYYTGRGKPIPRGRTSIQRGLDGSYKFVSAGPDQRRTEVSDSTGHVRGSYTYLDDKGVQHSVHYIAGPETGYRILKHVKGPHLPTVFPFGRPDFIPPDFYDYDKEVKDVFDTAASGHVKPSRPKATEATSEVGGKGSKSNPISSDEEEEGGDFGELFGGSSKGTTERPGGGYTPGIRRPSVDRNRPTTSRPIGGGSDEDGLYKPPGSTTTIKPPTESTNKVGMGIKEEDGGGYPAKPEPSPSFEEGSSSGGNDFGLFGSETNHPKPPYDGGPSISLRPVDSRCPKCGGTIVTNLGDTYFSVPPGVSVRAHIQAIDLLPLSPKVPSPSEQYKADLYLKREQLNASEDGFVSTNDGSNTTIISETHKLAIDASTVVANKNNSTTLEA